MNGTTFGESEKEEEAESEPEEEEELKSNKVTAPWLLNIPFRMTKEDWQAEAGRKEKRPCALCTKPSRLFTIKEKNTLKEHIAKVHLGRARFECSFCPFKIFWHSGKSIQVHMTVQHEDEVWSESAQRTTSYLLL